MWGSVNTGAGGGLAIKILGGQSKPSNPREGTVWIQTDLPITDTTFANDAPHTPAEGAVWVTIGAYSAGKLEATRSGKVHLTIYPALAKQWANGKWTIRQAQSYTAGAWRPWAFYLYSKGNENVDITGGWKLFDTGNATTGASVKKESDNMQLASSFVGGKHYAGGALMTASAIDLAQYKRIKLRYDISYTGLGVDAFLRIGSPTQDVRSVMLNSKAGSGLIAELDIAGLRSGQIGVWVSPTSRRSGNGGVTVIIHEVELEI